MSTTSQGNGFAGASATKTKLNADAIRFCKDLLSKPDVATGYYTTLTKAAKDKTYEPQILDNWLVSQNYQCSIQQVLLAQKQLPTYQLFYWSGGYKTLVGANKQTGPVVTIRAFKKGAQQIGYGEDFVIEPKFNSLVLSWGTDEGLNDTSGSLTFTLTRSSAAAAVRSFYGQVTDSTGNTQSIAGALMTTDELKTAASNKQAPPAQDMTALKIAETVVNFVAQLTMITLNFVLLYKAGKELQQLSQKAQANPDDAKAQKDLEDAQKDQDELESDNDDAVDQVDDLKSDYDAASDSDIESVMGEASGTNSVPLDLPDDPEAPSSEAQDLLNDAVEQSSESDPDDSSDDDSGGDDEDGDDAGSEGEDDAGDIFSDISEDLVEDI